MPIINYSQWEKEDEHLTPSVVEMLLSNEYQPIQEAMIYATKGKSKSIHLLNPKDLELLAVSFYERLPYKKVRYSGKHASSDGGVDVWLTRQDADTEIVQCKQLSAKVTREQIKEFVKTMRKVGAVKGYYWAPTGFSKPADEYAKSANEKVILYDADFIVKEVHEIFYDEVQRAREKVITEIKKQGTFDDVKIPAKNIVHFEKSPKKKKGWTVAQVTIMFGMTILACLSVYCLIATIATRGN